MKRTTDQLRAWVATYYPKGNHLTVVLADCLDEIDASAAALAASEAAGETLAEAAEAFIDAVDNHGDIVLTGGLCADAVAEWREVHRG